MIRLGHIVYSNCLPVHADLLDGSVPGVEIVAGVPAQLNRELASGHIDVAPCSSIEYARHASDYLILPQLAIASAGPVHSILLESTVAPEEMDGREVLVPTASATSVVLLRILLETRGGLRPRLRWYEQAETTDPLADGAVAALWIGDVALRRIAPPPRRVWDLGEAWTRWTGLPFVYAVWQARCDVDSGELRALHERLLASRSSFLAQLDARAARHSAEFGVPARRLADYWRSLRYSLGPLEIQGLLAFYRMAAELGEAPPVSDIAWSSTGATA